MSQKLVIEPVTRIEGHAKVTVHLDDQNHVERAVLHVNEFRGFEKFCEGRPFYEMPLITERICGICPVSHHLASVKACDQIIGRQPPRPAQMLRELMHMGQIIQSHGMHFFELAGPDLLLGFDADPATRNVVGLAAAAPETTLAAIQLRKLGQSIIAQVGDRRVHPNFAVPGGVNKALAATSRDELLKALPQAMATVQQGLGIVKAWMEKNPDMLRDFGSFSTNYLGMVDADQRVNLYEGDLAVVDAGRQPLMHFAGRDYLDHIAERVEEWSYLKFPFLKSLGWPGGTYRVGPLGRLNASRGFSTPLAQQEYQLFQQCCDGKVAEGTLYYHYARLIECLYAVERAAELLQDAEILSTDLLNSGGVSQARGVGVLEAPRGTLIHDYEVDATGCLTRVNLIVATGHNNYAMSRAVDEVAKRYLDGGNVTEGALNRIEAAIRAYDPCLSCSTHAVGQMPIQIVFVRR
jgi:NAD-reducing hydrogenase large subunit